MHTHDVALAPATRRALVAGTIAIGVLVAIAVVGISVRAEVDRSQADFLVGTVYEARVVDIRVEPCEGTTIDCIGVEVRLTQGPDDGETRTLVFTADSPVTPSLGKGDRIVLSYTEGADEGFEYTYSDRQRRRVLLAAAVVFGVAVVLLGRLRGLAALGGLVVSIGTIMVFVLPAILAGYSPVLVAVLGSAAIAYIALYLAHGLNLLTTVALLGTLAALALTVLLSAVFTALAEFSGFASEEALLLGNLSAGIDMSGLILAGIVIGALGALDDVTITQASAVAELREANPTMSRTAVYASAIRIGRDHIASTVNTLALAYAGAALPLLLLFVLSEQSLGTIANSEVVATEIIRTLVGSIGLVASVPITTWLAARVVAGPTGHEHPRARRPVADDETNFWE
ncbi:MAG: YibE/F family protein [Actinomycetota bacterium]|nr:YibE/F family protein [Actinomycetota bacterium]